MFARRVRAKEEDLKLHPGRAPAVCRRVDPRVQGVGLCFEWEDGRAFRWRREQWAPTAEPLKKALQVRGKALGRRLRLWETCNE